VADPQRPDRGVVVDTGGETGSVAPGAGRLAMAVFLASLSVLFLASLVAYAVVRLGAPSWLPPGTTLPRVSLLRSTLLLALCSVAIQRGLNAIRRGDGVRLGRNLYAGLGLATAFLVSQVDCWMGLFAAGVVHTHSLYGFAFLMLTGLHALHVLGGVVALIVVVVAAHRRAYSWARYAGVRHTVTYWHFLGVVWLVLVGVLLVG
jgi:cytochrome c oxidase subunit 3